MFERVFPRFLGALMAIALSSFFAGKAVAAGPHADAERCEASAATFLPERLAVWQQRLGLQSWTISVVQSHPRDLKPDTLGNIHWDADRKSAVIRVLDSADYKMPFREMLEDMEFTIVHELIHLELSSLPRSEASRRDEEYAVNQIADALLKLDRGR